MHLRPGGRPLCAVGLLAFALVGAFCGSALGATTSTTVPVTAGPLHLRTDVNPHADALAFFPRVVTVHAGDAVRWDINGFHTVTFPGSLNPYPFVATTAAKQPVKNDAAGTPFGGPAPHPKPSSARWPSSSKVVGSSPQAGRYAAPACNACCRPRPPTRLHRTCFGSPSPASTATSARCTRACTA